MTAERTKRKDRPAAIRVVLPFVFRHWLEQPRRMATVAGGFLGATVADLFMPVFSGHLVDALTRGAEDAGARHAAFAAFGGIVAMGLTSMILRTTGLQAMDCPECRCSRARAGSGRWCTAAPGTGVAHAGGAPR